MDQADAAARVPQQDGDPLPSGEGVGRTFRWAVALPLAFGATSVVVALLELLAGPASGRSAVLAVVCLAAVAAWSVPVVMFWGSGRRELAIVQTALLEAAAGHCTRVNPGTARLFPELADSANAVIDRFRQTIMLVARSSVALSAGRTGIHDVSERISTMAESTAGQAAGASGVAEQVSGSVEVVASSSYELAANIGSVSEHASRVLEVTSAATSQGQHAVEMVATLNDVAQEIERAVGLIATIAGQTRMLAFNATIEAVRAGEAGTGFAVVASEVRALAQTTATATDSIVQSVHAIQEGTGRAEAVIGTIVETIRGLSENQVAIASAVEEQTATTNEIQQCAASAAAGTGDIVHNIRALADAARVTAHAGAQIRTTSGELALIGDDLATVLDGFDVDVLLAELSAQEPERPPAPTATVRDGVTWVEDTVMGSGEAQFEYVGDWAHSDANAETNGSNSYDITPDDVANLRFTGTKVRFYAVTGPNHGIGAASVDGGEERLMDMYSPERAASVLLFESPTLPHGPHMLTIRVTGQWNPNSRYGWVTIDRAEFE